MKYTTQNQIKFDLVLCIDNKNHLPELHLSELKIDGGSYKQYKNFNYIN